MVEKAAQDLGAHSMTPDEMRKRSDVCTTVHHGYGEHMGDAWQITAELCARLDAQVTMGERIVKALELLAKYREEHWE
jgi:hypothetical protein